MALFFLCLLDNKTVVYPCVRFLGFLLQTAYNENSVELTTFQERGTGMPRRKKFKAHAVLRHPTLLSVFKKLPVFSQEC